MMNMTTEKELHAMVEQVAMTIEDKWLLDASWDLEDGYLNMTVCYRLAEVEVFDDDIVGMSQEEILDAVEEHMVSAFLDFDLEEEKIKRDSDIDVYDALDDDNKEYKKIAFLISRQNHGASWKQIKFESTLFDERGRLGGLVAKETNPILQMAYATALSGIAFARELFAYMRMDVDSKQFFKVLENNPQINAYCVLGQYDKAKKEFLATM